MFKKNHLITLTSLTLLAINISVYPASMPSVVDISTVQDLDNMLSNNQTAGIIFVLKNDIDAENHNFKPRTTTFQGTFDGQKHQIQNFIDTQALFHTIDDGALIKDLQLTNITITNEPDGYKAALVTLQDGGTISNVHVLSGIVGKGDSPEDSVSLGEGGLVSIQSSGRIEYSSFAGTLALNTHNSFECGGLVGIQGGIIDSSTFSGNIIVGNNGDEGQGTVTEIGGLSGYDQGGQITHSASSGTIQLRKLNGGQNSFIGGLAGVMTIPSKGNDIPIIDTSSSSTTIITSKNTTYTANLAGASQGIIKNSYANGVIQGPGTYSSGLVGKLNSGGKIINSYSTTKFTNHPTQFEPAYYGLVADADDNVVCSNSYWDGNINDPPAQPNLKACPNGRKTTAQMQTQSTYAEWDFTNIWSMMPAAYPTLR